MSTSWVPGQTLTASVLQDLLFQCERDNQMWVLEGSQVQSEGWPCKGEGETPRDGSGFTKAPHLISFLLGTPAIYFLSLPLSPTSLPFSFDREAHTIWVDLKLARMTLNSWPPSSWSWDYRHASGCQVYAGGSNPGFCVCARQAPYHLSHILSHRSLFRVDVCGLCSLWFRN